MTEFNPYSLWTSGVRSTAEQSCSYQRERRKGTSGQIPLYFTAVKKVPEFKDHLKPVLLLLSETNEVFWTSVTHVFDVYLTVVKNYKPGEDLIEKLLYIISILLREHGCTFKRLKRRLDAVQIFVRYEILSWLEKLAMYDQLSESLQSYCQFLIREYYHTTGELPPMSSTTEQMVSTTAVSTASSKKKEKARHVRQKMLRKMKKQQEKAMTEMVEDFEVTTGQVVEKLVEDEEKKEARVRNSIATDSSNGSEFNRDIASEPFTCSICRGDTDLAEPVKEDDGNWVLACLVTKTELGDAQIRYNNTLIVGSTSDQFTVTTCGHAFHNACLKRVRNSNCPYCTTTYNSTMPVVHHQTVAFFRSKTQPTSNSWKWLCNTEKFLEPPPPPVNRTFVLRMKLDIPDPVQPEIKATPEPPPKPPTPEPESHSPEPEKVKTLEPNKLTQSSFQDIINFLRGYTPSDTDLPEDTHVLLSRAISTLAFNIETVEKRAYYDDKVIFVGENGLTYRCHLGLNQFVSMIIVLCSGIKLKYVTPEDIGVQPRGRMLPRGLLPRMIEQGIGDILGERDWIDMDSDEESDEDERENEDVSIENEGKMDKEERILSETVIAARSMARQVLKDLVLCKDQSVEDMIPLETSCILIQKVFESFTTAVLTVGAMPTNAGEADATKYLINYTVTNKTLVTVYSMIAITQGLLLSQEYDLQIEEHLVDIDQVLTIDEQTQLEDMFVSVFQIEDISKNNIKMAIYFYGVFLRRVAILFSTMNRQSLTFPDTLDSLKNRKFTRLGLNTLMSYCGLKGESILSVFDCGGSASLLKYLNIWKSQLLQNLNDFKTLPKPIIEKYLCRTFKTLTPLPPKFTDLAKLGYEYQCPNHLKLTSLTTTGGSSTAGTHAQSIAFQVTNNTSHEVVLCLFCGELLCWNGYCCKIKVGEKRAIGAVTQHAKNKHDGFALVLRINQNKIFARNCNFQDGRRFHTGAGAANLPAPYLDKYGEFDASLVTGQQLFFSSEHYDKILKLFLTQQLILTFNPHGLDLGIFVDTTLDEL